MRRLMMTETQICAAEGCANEFVAGNGKKYCCTYCKRHSKLCVDCGVLIGSGSARCRLCASKRRNYGTDGRAICRMCGKEFRKTHIRHLRCLDCRNRGYKPRNTMMNCAAPDCSNTWIRRTSEKYCSNVCRKKWRGKVICPSCELNPMSYDSAQCADCYWRQKANHSYCHNCGKRIRAENNLCQKCKDWLASLPEPTVRMICPYCKQWFEREIRKWRWSKKRQELHYCSYECKARAVNEKYPRTKKYWDVVYPCDYCGKNFCIEGKRYRAKAFKGDVNFYCSSQCAKLGKQNIFRIPYRQVHGIRGIVLPIGMSRREMLNSNNGMCWKCLRNPSTDLHHVKPVRNGGSDHWTNLFPLCEQCHYCAFERKSEKEEREKFGRGWYEYDVEYNMHTHEPLRRWFAQDNRLQQYNERSYERRDLTDAKGYQKYWIQRKEWEDYMYKEWGIRFN